MAISDWPEAERPRERLATHGAGALSNAELLALVLRSGTHGKSAIALAQEMLNAAGGLAKLMHSDLKALQATPGMGIAKSTQFKAALELARRALQEQVVGNSVLDSPASMRDFLRLTLAGREHEVFGVILLDAKYRCIGFEELFRGTLNQASVYPREVVKLALARNAAALAFAHNHPSGVAEPSHADELLTRNLKKALALVDVQVIDHFIVAPGGVMSFAERGLL